MAAEASAAMVAAFGSAVTGSPLPGCSSQIAMPMTPKRQSATILTTAAARPGVTQPDFVVGVACVERDGVGGPPGLSPAPPDSPVFGAGVVAGLVAGVRGVSVKVGAVGRLADGQ